MTADEVQKLRVLYQAMQYDMQAAARRLKQMEAILEQRLQPTTPLKLRAVK